MRHPMTKRRILFAIAGLCVSAMASLAAAQQPAAPAPAPRPAAPQPPPLPALLFRMALQNEMRSPLTQTAVTAPNVDLQLYGDGRNIIVATGRAAQLPRLFFGLCKGPCGFTVRDRNSAFDLRGRASIRFTTIVSG